MPSTNSFPSYYQSMSYTLNTLFHLKQSLLFSSFLEFGFQPNTALVKFSTPPFYFSSLPPRLFQNEEHTHTYNNSFPIPFHVGYHYSNNSTPKYQIKSHISLILTLRRRWEKLAHLHFFSSSSLGRRPSLSLSLSLSLSRFSLFFQQLVRRVLGARRGTVLMVNVICYLNFLLVIVVSTFSLHLLTY